MKSLNISIVLPVETSKHKKFDSLFKSCVTSIQNQNKLSDKGESVVGDLELVIVHSGEESLETYINNFDFSGLTTNIIKNDGETDFCSQINLGVEGRYHGTLCSFR